jgi:Zn-dependent protease with chaperone function
MAAGSMELTALVLLVLGLVLAEPASRWLAAAAWPERDPVGGLLLWQAVGLAGGLSLVGAGLVFGLAPFGSWLPASVAGFWRAVGSGSFPPSFDLGHAIALLAAVVIGLRLVGVLISVTVRTLRARARHRDLLDLLGTPWPSAPGAHVLDHPVPVAYCLPGLRSRLVVSAGVLDTLNPAQVRAVLAHERTHLRERHDLVVLPFVAWGATAPFVRGMVRAQLAVAALIEMRADDVAGASAEPACLTAALGSMGRATPAAALTSFTTALDRRLTRIASPPPPLPLGTRVLVRLLALALVVGPTALLLTP